jgi:hypothetical protein
MPGRRGRRGRGGLAVQAAGAWPLQVDLRRRHVSERRVRLRLLFRGGVAATILPWAPRRSTSYGRRFSLSPTSRLGARSVSSSRREPRSRPSNGRSSSRRGARGLPGRSWPAISGSRASRSGLGIAWPARTTDDAISGAAEAPAGIADGPRRGVPYAREGGARSASALSAAVDWTKRSGSALGAPRRSVASSLSSSRRSRGSKPTAASRYACRAISTRATSASASGTESARRRRSPSTIRTSPACGGCSGTRDRCDRRCSSR